MRIVISISDLSDYDVIDVQNDLNAWLENSHPEISVVIYVEED